MNKKYLLIYTLISLVVSPLLLLSCRGDGGDREVWSGPRDRVEEVAVVPVDGGLPPMHSNTHLLVMGDSLLFQDSQDTRFQFKVYDIRDDRYVGSFGRYGNGPGEIANVGGRFYDPVHRILYVMNNNRWNIVGFDIDAALADSAYRPLVKMSIDRFNKPRPFRRPVYVNDSTIFCNFYIPDPKWRGLTSQLGMLDLAHGEIEDWEHTRWKEGSYFGMGLSLSDSIIVTPFLFHDRLCIYDLRGNLRRTVYGPDFSEERPGGNYYYYGDPIVANNHIYCIYVGRDIRRCRYGSDIVVMDLEGNYVKTMATGLLLQGIAYHEGTNRIYVTTDSDPQFGYIQLGEG